LTTRTAPSSGPPPSLHITESGSDVHVALHGSWTIWHLQELAAIKAGLNETASSTGRVMLHPEGLSALDPSGTAVLIDLFGARLDLPASPLSQGQRHLFDAVQVAAKASAKPKSPPVQSGALAVGRRLVVGLGNTSMHFWEECVDSVRFLGLMLITLFRVLIRPRRLRWNAIFHHMEEAGIDAIPLVVVLSFFIGMVLAFMSARLLGQFGASLLTVDLVSIAMLREFGVVMTAIILAGRSNSAFTAQIGAMRMQREVDAMQVMGVDPFEALVIPRLIATMVMVPLLSVVAMASGIVGGMLVAWNAFDLSPILFFARMQEVVPVSNFWVGIAKAPVFGLVMALVGCRQGMLVGGTVASLGQRTTSSVVQAIFLVIVIDALFAILYLEMDV